MKGKIYNIELTDIEIRHILSLLYERKEGGSYYGIQKIYYARTDKIINKLEEV